MNVSTAVGITKLLKDVAEKAGFNFELVSLATSEPEDIRRLEIKPPCFLVIDEIFYIYRPDIISAVMQKIREIVQKKEEVADKVVIVLK